MLIHDYQIDWGLEKVGRERGLLSNLFHIAALDMVARLSWFEFSST